MAVIVLTSASGSPGVTTIAVGLTLTWHRSVLLVDADPGAHQAVLAGYLGGQVATGKGLQRVAEAHRDRRPLLEVVSDETVPLTAVELAGEGTDHGDDEAERADSGPSRRLLPGFARPANAGLFGPVWSDLADTFVRLETAGIDVIVDAGRMERQGLPQPLLDRGDLLLLVTRSNLRSLVSARTYAGVLREQARMAGREVGLGVIVVGEGKPYGSREIGRLLQMPVVSVLADDPTTAGAFSDGAPRSRRFDRSPLVRSLHRSVGELSGHVRRRRERLGLVEQVLPDPVEPPEPDSTRSHAPVGGGQRV
ncbi:hypothetical protein [Microlunatus sp. Gsoil 973]|jgi:hypothetical protein|uniref:hypothetical protein n=1 Tax=Microlunatus sp. Gsoil 973 TaxID=2672569 RepID=UPI0012B4B911|nr:hypothetical protein [Microlunatus sp. Gsoil 973]QGN34566.1 hypothetical protein GJV80_19010 [Microlunatus sp. Gsoil 973]